VPCHAGRTALSRRDDFKKPPLSSRQLKGRF
jgi:hypothetical protein